VNGAVEYLHKGRLGSVKLITAADGSLVKRPTYAPFGEATDEMLSLARADETKGNTCERFDVDAGLQYLNARYYDPRLGMFIQPDWLDPTQPPSTQADEMWRGNAPDQVEPGITHIQHEKYNPRTGELEVSDVEYDQYGRQVYRTDHTDHGYP